MLKIFISQPVKGLIEEEILNAKQYAINLLKEKFKEEIEIIDTYFKDFNGNSLEFLGKSISEGLAQADVAIFLSGWEKADGCRCEQFIASQYGVKCFYINDL